MQLIYITFIIVFCIDLSGAIPKLNKLVWGLLYPNIKYKDWQIPLISCSLCVTWWVGIVYLLFTGFTWLGLLEVALLAWLTPAIGTLLIVIKDLIIKILNKC